jgi:hypothetical protein
MSNENVSKAKEIFSFLGDEFFKTNRSVLCVTKCEKEMKEALDSLNANSFFVDDQESLNSIDQKFDLVFLSKNMNSFSLPKTLEKAEASLVEGGLLFAQCTLTEIPQEDFHINNPIYDFLIHTNTLFCNTMGSHESNILERNFSLIFTKSKELTDLYENYGSLSTIDVPQEYMVLWNEINLSIQDNKLNTSMIYDDQIREKTLTDLSKRAYYLTRIAKSFDCKDIAEVGTAEGWQYYNFCKYVDEENPDGSVVTCDPRDVRNSKYKNMYKDNRFRFYNATSKELSDGEGKKDLFYVDGLHDENTVLLDVLNMQNLQYEEKRSVWILDDFDIRFGCFKDILALCNSSRCFKVYRVGNTASGKPSHQAIIHGNLRIQTKQV